MRRTFRHIGLLLLTGALAWVVSAGGAAAQPTPTAPPLAGAWQLNRDLSTAPGSGPGADVGRGGGGGGGRRGGFGGGLGGRRGGRAGAPAGGPAAEGRMAQLREAMGELLQPAARLTVVQHDGAVSFTDDQGHVRKFVVNGRKETHQLQSATLETRAQWKDGALVIEWETGRGPTVVRTYRTQPQSGQLIIETTFEGGRGGGDRPPVRHVYDPATAP